MCSGIVLPFVAKPAREALGFTPHADVRQPPHPRQVRDPLHLLGFRGGFTGLTAVGGLLQVVENALSKEG